VQTGEAVEVTVSGIPTEFAGRSAEVVVVGIDRFETHWQAVIPGRVTEKGALVGRWEPSLADETVLETVRVRLATNESEGAWSWELSGSSAGRCILGGEHRDWMPNDLARRADELRAQQESRYAQPTGDPEGAGAREHRVLCVVERLRSTRELKFPGARVVPLDIGNPGSGEPPYVEAILDNLGWPTRIERTWWAEHSAKARPWTAIVISPVYAPGHNDAAQLAWRVRDRITDVLALTRGSSPRPLVTVVEQRQHPNGVKWGYYFEDDSYRGNLIGGFIAGEDQRELLMADAAMAHDPLLALCVRLFRDAQGETDADAAYFRYWSLLETLSNGRFGAPHQDVALLDGSSWPSTHNTTEYAAPRVYALVASHLDGRSETSHVAPAPSLYEAVRAWYGRRNATAHHGRFDDACPAQQARPWFKWALETKSSPDRGFGSWLWTLQDIANLVLRRELMAVGRAAL
jgi:hypothetical protein